MADFPSKDDLFRIARDEVLDRSTRLTKDVVERDGTDANALLEAMTAVGDELVGQASRIEADLFLDSAKKRALDRLVFDRYNLLRKPAAPAVGSVDFSLPTAAASSFSIPVGTRLSTADGRVFLTTVATTFPAGSVGPVSVAVQSALAGINQQAKIGTITSIISTIAGSPTGLAVTNSVATAGADNREEDDDFRDRARRFWTTVAKGTLAAIEQDALTVPGVRRASAREYLDCTGQPAKAVELIVADAFTDALVAVTPTPAAYETQSQVLATAVSTGLSDTRAAGIPVTVRVAQIIVQGVTLGLAFHAGVDVDLVAFRARVAIVTYINGLNPGATAEISGMINALRAVPGLVISGGEILSPSGDVVPSPLQAIRTTIGIVVASSMQPDATLQGSTNPDV